MRLLDRVILRCEGNIPQLAPSSQLSWKTLHSVMLGAIESLECLGVSEKARLGNMHFLATVSMQSKQKHRISMAGITW